jgi:hypothetical protein
MLSLSVQQDGKTFSSTSKYESNEEKNKRNNEAVTLEKAGDGTRTHDILLGKQTLYQLSYTRVM